MEREHRRNSRQEEGWEEGTVTRQKRLNECIVRLHMVPGTDSDLEALRDLPAALYSTLLNFLKVNSGVVVWEMLS